MPAHLLLARDQCGAEFTQIDAPLAIKIAQPLHRAVDVDRRIMPERTQFGDHPLRLAQRIGPDQHATLRLRRQRREQFRHFIARFGMTEDGQAERRFGDENIARHGLEARARRVRAPLVIARHHNALTRIFEQYLRRAEYMTGGHERRFHITDDDTLTISHGGPTRLFAIAHAHDRERLGRRPHGAMPAACMIGMAMRDERTRHRARRVYPRIGRGNVNSVRMRFDPCA